MFNKPYKIRVNNKYVNSLDFSSLILGLNKLFSYPEKIILAMSCLLDNIKKCVLHYDLSDFFELVIQD